MGGGKGIGGSSHINFQVYSRGWDENYDRWEREYGATGWNSTEMLHFMKLHENVHNEPTLKNGLHHHHHLEDSLLRFNSMPERSVQGELLIQ